jgi:hypothetical protein
MINIRLIEPDREKYRDFAYKKACLCSALDQVKFNLILQTDGDCSVGPHWITSFISTYLARNPKLIAGPVVYPAHNCIEEMLQLDLTSLVGVGAATIQLGLPTMCNGANLFFEKPAFIDAGGYGRFSHYPSGDDEFLLHIFHKNYPGEIQFLKNVQGIVSTKPPASLGEFFHQRIRWAAKWSTFHGLQNIILAVFIFIFNAVLLSLTLISLFGKNNPILILCTVWIIKLLAEYVLLKKILVDLGIRISRICFLVAGILYPLYAVIFGLLANFITPSWKTRQLN